MRANTKTNRKVRDAVDNCRKELTAAIISDMKRLGIEPGQEMELPRTLILYPYNKGVHSTLLVRCISYFSKSAYWEPFFVTILNDEHWEHSSQLSIDCLTAIHDETYKMVHVK